MPRWNPAPSIPKEIDGELHHYPKLVRQMLYRRGIETRDRAERFLHPDYERDLNDPFGLIGMDRAVGRIIEAIKLGERIVIYADYDADGIPGSVILNDFFVKIGFTNFSVYIPHRYTEGYGLHRAAVESFGREGANLIITIDTGISNVAEIACAGELGIDVIVIDHHLPGNALPEAYAIVNPNQEGDAYPCRFLSAGGLVFKLVQGLLKRGNFDLTPGWEKWLLDVTSISTIADMVPLKDENRALAYFGLSVLKKTTRPGLVGLFRSRRIRHEDITEDDVGFVITPRINVASRLDVPMNAFHLLATRDGAQASHLLAHLEEKNTERKQVVLEMMEDITDRLKDWRGGGLIYIGDTSWKPGVLGLAAMRIVELYHTPAFVWGQEGSTVVRGSARSDGSINVVRLMEQVPEGFFLDYGGHSRSGGFSVEPGGTSRLGEALYHALLSTPRGVAEDDAVTVESSLALEDVTWELYNSISSLAPFGVGNPKPIFLFEKLCVIRVNRFGANGIHLRLDLESEKGTRASAIGFNHPKEFSANLVGEDQRVDVLATVERNTWCGARELRLRLVGINARPL